MTTDEAQQFAGGLQMMTEEFISHMRPEKIEDVLLKAASIIIQQSVENAALKAEVERLRKGKV